MRQPTISTRHCVTSSKKVFWNPRDISYTSGLWGTGSKSVGVNQVINLFRKVKSYKTRTTADDKIFVERPETCPKRCKSEVISAFASTDISRIFFSYTREICKTWVFPSHIYTRGSRPFTTARQWLWRVAAKIANENPASELPLRVPKLLKVATWQLPLSLNTESWSCSRNVYYGELPLPA
jgi:hypothetical protein